MKKFRTFSRTWAASRTFILSCISTFTLSYLRLLFHHRLHCSPFLRDIDETWPTFTIPNLYYMFSLRVSFCLHRPPHNASSTSIPEPKQPSATARWPSGPQSCCEEVCRVQYRLVSARLPSYLWRLWRREPGHPEPAGGAGDDQKAPKIWQLVC